MYLCILGILVSGSSLLESNEKRLLSNSLNILPTEALKETKSNESYSIHNLTAGDSLDFSFSIWAKF